jgi:glycosyltransferase involved in cell wall biosynthesis
MKFCCVTPCLNSEKYIEETMLSVLTQNIFSRPDCFLSYIVQDGGSCDDTLKKVKQIADQFIDHKNIQIEYYSEEDSGMYDALAKGFENKIDSDVYSYINAGDIYSRYAFEIVFEIFTKYQVHFLTGINVNYNEKSHVVNFRLPFEYNKNLLLKGLYGTVLPFIQQESTFWDKTIQKKIDFKDIRQFKYAGDFYLWKTFINYADLYIVSAWLGGFKHHKGQLSSQFINEYKTEMKNISISPTMFDYILAYIHKFLQYSPNKIKKKLSTHMFEYDHINQKYCLTNILH